MNGFVLNANNSGLTEMRENFYQEKTLGQSFSSMSGAVSDIVGRTITPEQTSVFLLQELNKGRSLEQSYQNLCTDKPSMAPTAYEDLVKSYFP